MRLFNIFIVCLLFIAASCRASGPELTVEWEGGGDMARLYLVEGEFPRHLSLIDSAALRDGRFAFSTRDKGSQLYELRVGETAERLFIEPVDMEVRRSAGSGFTVSGSPLDGVYRRYLSERDVIYRDAFMDSLDAAHRQARRQGDKQEEDRLMAEIMQWRGKIMDEESVLTRRVVEANRDNALGMYVYLSRDFFRRFFPAAEDVERERNFLAGFGPDAQRSPMFAQMQRKLTLFEGCMVGADAPEITGLDTLGRRVNLSDFRGKYVIVDFWASWCHWCRVETPNFKAAMERFRGRDFTILGVSSDESRDKWVEAVREDQTTWPQLLLDPDGKVYENYCINGIPHILLVGPDGKILAKGLRGDDMTKIPERFMGQ